VDARLPAHLEIAGLIRRVQAEGGFAAVIKKGERDAGTILVVITENGENSRAYERMPQLDGSRAWTCSQKQDPENKEYFLEYLERRGKQDPDLWILELDIARGERFIGLSPDIC
jgi:hypothetical protein